MDSAASGAAGYNGQNSPTLTDSAVRQALWRTPLSLNQGETGNIAGQNQLGVQVRQWMTPMVPNGGRSVSEETVLRKGMTETGKRTVGLESQVRYWPTPTASDWKGGNHSEGGSASTHSTAAAENWATPRASDGEKGGPNQQFGAGGTPLPSQAVNWAKPTTRDYKDGDCTASEVPTNSLLGAKPLG
jgi:hypothetical protein